MKAVRSSLAINLEKRDGITILHFDGDLDQKALPRAKRLVGEQLTKDGGKLRLVMDLANVQFIDSAGLGFFIGSLKKIKEARGSLKLANLNAYMMGIFKLINLHYIIDVYDDLDKAVRSFAQGEAQSAR